MTMLQIALACIQRGWAVFPCWPKTKNPLTKHGFKDASNSKDTVEQWWASQPDANVAIATGPSGLTVLDIDHGLEGYLALGAWMQAHGESYAVKTGRKDSFGVQVYFQGGGLKSIAWEAEGLSGDIRSATGYVMAAGCIHPSGDPYAVMFDAPVMPEPEWVRALAPAHKERDAVDAVGDEDADEWKTWLEANLQYFCHSLVFNGYEKRVTNGWWLGIECPWVAEHASGPGADSSTVLGVLDGKLAFECSHGTCKAAKRDTAALRAWLAERGEHFGPEPGADPMVTLGKAPEPPLEPVDWRSHYHTFEAMNNAPEPVFLIQDFLQYESITAIAAPVGQRKSILALNVADALCSGRPLFDKFPVLTVPSRVLYLCPEMGIRSFADRTRKVGLMPFVGKTLFVRTMSPVNPANELQEELTLDELQPEEVDGAVVIIDTAVRFIQGDENSSEHMRVFARSIFRLTKLHAAAVVVLFHSGKGTKEAPELTLENAMRGSGELGAFVTCCWATRLQDPEHPYISKSYLANVKPRDFDAKPFEVVGSRNEDGSGLNDCRMHFVDNGEAPVVLSKKQRGKKADADGKDDAARAVVQANHRLTVPALVALLAELGIDRKKTWVTEARLEARGAGTKLSTE